MHRRDSGWLLFGRQRNCNRTFPQQEPKRALPFPQQEPSVAFPATGTQTIIAFPPTPSRPIQQGCFLLSLLIAPQQTIPENSAVLRIPNQHFQLRTTPRFDRRLRFGLPELMLCFFLSAPSSANYDHHQQAPMRICKKRSKKDDNNMYKPPRTRVSATKETNKTLTIYIQCIVHDNSSSSSNDTVRVFIGIHRYLKGKDRTRRRPTTSNKHINIATITTSTPLTSHLPAVSIDRVATNNPKELGSRLHALPPFSKKNH